MQQVDELLKQLKKALRLKGLNYKDVGKVLNLSESSVKRIFSQASIGLDRVEKICHEFEISFFELCGEVAKQSSNNEKVFSPEQEKVFAKDLRILNVFTLLQKGQTPEQILKDYEIEKNELLQMLLKLDKIKLIELLKNDRVKILPGGLYRFNKGGAIGKKIFEQTKESFLNHNFQDDSSHIRFTTLPLTKHLRLKLQRQMDQLSKECISEAQFSRNQDDATETGVLFAFRPWHFGKLDLLKKRVVKT